MFKALAISVNKAIQVSEKLKNKVPSTKGKPSMTAKHECCNNKL